MKKIGLLVGILIWLAGAFVSGVALAYPFRVGVYMGGFYPYPYYYPYPYAPYYPPVVVAPAQPSVYVEQAAPQQTAAPQENNYWYYCDKSKSYYPYVKECPGGWKAVEPTAPSQH